jgi:hypothetical protein
MLPMLPMQWAFLPSWGPYVDFHAKLTRHFHLKLTHPLA